jgi:hypothetical protein
MRAALASRSMGGPSSSCVGKNCKCLCGWLAPLRSPPSGERGENHQARHPGRGRQPPCTHSCRRRIDAFLSCALREVVDTPGRGHSDAAGTSGSGILHIASKRSVSVVSSCACDRSTHPPLVTRRKCSSTTEYLLSCSRLARAHQPLIRRPRRSHTTDQDYVFRALSFIL